jgi:predicted dehydrogenase
MAPLRLAIIGGGRVTERYHLPVVMASPEVRLRAVVDPEPGRAAALAALVAGARGLRDAGELAEIDAAIVATPHHLHAAIAAALLEQGIHVLVEKPMALDAASCDRMIAAAGAGSALLAVGLVRRWYDASGWLEELLAQGGLGRVERVEAREGSPFAWQVASDATFRRGAGGGVLADIGAHLLDLLCWWLGDPRPLAYRDDAMGGVEAEAELELEFPGGARGSVELSRTRQLRNTIVIRGERATASLGVGPDPEVWLRLAGSNRLLRGRIRPEGGGPADLTALFEAQLRDFVDAIREQRPPFVSGLEGRRSVALIEACRRIRTSLELPWLAPSRAPEREGLEAVACAH